MPNVQLFRLPETKAALSNASAILTKHEPNEIPHLLGRALKDISLNAERFDDNCQINLQWIGEAVVGELKAVIENDDDPNVAILATTIFRFVTEYDLSVRDDMSSTLRNFSKAVLTGLDFFNENEREQILFATRQMPVAVVKRIVNSDEFGNIRNISDVAARVEKTIQGWEGTLKNAEETTVRLAASLEEHTKEFNFVGLREGFADLATTIEAELKSARKFMAVFGSVALAPGALDVWFVLSGKIDLTKLSLSSFALVGIGTISITVLILYYFRIALRKADSCNVQLTQLRLRMSLCRFIQSYADYAGPIKVKNPDALAKFETLIFAGLVSSEDKLPSTFDGIEQLSSLAKSFKGG